MPRPGFDDGNGTMGDNTLGDYIGFRSRLRQLADGSSGTTSFSIDEVNVVTSVVPEPASLGMLAIGGLLLGRRTRR